MSNNPYTRIAEDRRPARRQTASRKPQAPAGLRATARRGTPSRKVAEMFDGQGQYNPERYDYNTMKRAAATNTDRRRMFDSKGQINAYSKKEALTQAYHLLTNATKKNAAHLNFSSANESGMSKEARRDVLAAALNDSQGFRVVGQELALPIKDILDYEGFARKIFRIRKLAQAELFRVPLDIRSTAWVIAGDGKSPRSVIKTKWVIPDETKITSFPVIDIMDIYQMNFDVLDRAQDTARQEIELAEDKRAVTLLTAAAQTVNTVTTYATLGVAAFEDVRFQVERHRLMVERFAIARSELSDVVKNMSSVVDPVTERELLLSGYIGNFLNAQILTAAGTGVEEVIPSGTFFAMTGPDYLGEMGIRIELFSEPFNEYSNQRTTKGWAFCEVMGFVLPNSKAVAIGQK